MPNRERDTRSNDRQVDSLFIERSPMAADLYGDLLDITPVPPGRLHKYWPGVVVVGIAALAASYLAERFSAPLMLTGLLIGFMLNFVGSDARLQPGLMFASKNLLRVGIVCVGAQVTFGQIVALGWNGFGAIVIIMASTIFTGVAIAKCYRLGTSFGILAGGAVAICGASAALAFSSLLGEKRVTSAQLTFTLVAISAASAFAMVTYPLVAELIALDDQQVGFLLGASIHDVAQALGAGYSVSPETGDTATIVKLTRVTLLAPTLAIVAFFLSNDGGKTNYLPGVPWFVIGFFALVSLNSIFMVPDELAVLAGSGANALLLMAVVATGIGSPVQMIIKQGWRSSIPVFGATIVSFLLSLAAAVLIGKS